MNHCIIHGAVLDFLEKVVEKRRGCLMGARRGEVVERGDDHEVSCEFNLVGGGGRDIVGRPGTRRVDPG